jgi:hypothetical protein
MLRPVATFRRYLKIQLMMFVFGIVGPIFLIGYSVSEPDPSLKWMYWWSLFITFFDILLALTLTAGNEPENACQEG